jgi:YegS/Rv2252/BmrU family lipid kinase
MWNMTVHPTQHRNKLVPKSNKRFLTIVNPRGGAKRGMGVTAQVKPIFTKAGAELVVHFTEYGGHATQIVQAADFSDYDGICVIGGDGTTHEVVTGLMRRSDGARLPIGLIPAGTGNTLHHHLQCGDPIEAARRIVQLEAHPLDVVRVETHDETAYCINIVGWGAVADINRRAERLRMLRKSRYAVATLVQILSPRPLTASIRLDDLVIEDRFLFVLGCNTKYTGTDMIVAPDAEVDDGLIDVVLLRNTSRRETLKMFRKVFEGTHLSLPSIECHQVRTMSIQSAGSQPLNLDGELKGYSPLTAEVMAGALQVYH